VNIEWVRRFCLSLPHTTETVQWGNDLVFKVGGKMYAVAMLEPGPHWLSFKCTPEAFGELTERPGIAPAPYLARAQWVAVEHPSVLSRGELEHLLRTAYEMVFAKLPKKVRASLGR
jgi:predicted DNA-binding protein (MmcQ/YjbR family)